MEPLEFGKFIVHLVTWFWDVCVFFTVCNQGQAVIKKRWGYPIKWRTKPRLYWKWPFIDMFDKVDMRKRYAQLNAHSFYGGQQKNDTMIPYNIIIDFQIEYQVINPLVIYEFSGYAAGEDIALSYVNNAVHSQLSEFIQKKGGDFSYDEILLHVNELKGQCFRKILDKAETEFDDKFLNPKRKELDINECISINKVVITSFDRNISLRTTI